MLLKVISSSSKGNLYAFISEKETLIWEAGISMIKLKKALNFDISKIVGCIASHVHSDHFGKAKEFLKAGIDIYTSQGTINFSGINHHRLHAIEIGKQFKLGDFTILAFPTIHDAPDSIGFMINHPEMGNTLALTDTYYVEFKFKGLTNILMEVNYDPEILEQNIEAGYLHPGVKNRIITSHLSINTAIDLLKANDLSLVNNVVLIHLSSGNSHAVDFQKIIEGVTGKKVTVADAGVEIEINKKPF
jgi:phosphoribosyl 1,2-cyclic phosphodiesterase